MPLASRFTFAALIVAVLCGVACNKKQEPITSTPLKEPAKPVTLEEGMTYQVIATGSGETAKNGDMVNVNYAGYLPSGWKFDSSEERGKPMRFKLGAGRVIRGLDLGVLGMREGEKRKLRLPPKVAWGPEGDGPVPPNTPVVMEVELVDVE